MLVKVGVVGVMVGVMVGVIGVIGVVGVGRAVFAAILGRANDKGAGDATEGWFTSDKGNKEDVQAGFMSVDCWFGRC